MADNDGKFNVKRYYNDLSRLFKSGPVVRHRIANKVAAPGSVGVPIGTARAFLKHVNNSYASTIASYGQYNRLARYSDYNEMECLHPTTLVYTIEHGWLEIQKLSEMYSDKTEKFHVYSYDHQNQKIVIDEAYNVRPTKVDMTYKISFDDGGFIIANSTHPFMLRDGSYKQVKDLETGESLMPLYKAKFIKNREYVFINTLNGKGEKDNRRWQKEHSYIVEHFQGRMLTTEETIHHKNFRADDNRLKNLELMLKHDHLSYHATLNNKHKWSNPLWVAKFSRDHSKFMTDNNPAYRKDITFEKIDRYCKLIVGRGEDLNFLDVISHFDTDHRVILRRLKREGFSSLSGYAKTIQKDWKHVGSINVGSKNPRFRGDITFQSICNKFQEGKLLSDMREEFNCSRVPIIGRLKENGFKNWRDFSDNYGNHKVVSIDPYEKTWVYDLTTVNHHNFAVCGVEKWKDRENDVRMLQGAVFVHNSMAEIHSALDIYADESCSPGEYGEILRIDSPNAEIRKSLNNLFYDVLNIEFNSWNWIRNLCKYGDQFLLVDHHPDYGILGLFPMPINEVEREEGYDENDPTAYRYRWITQGNRVLEAWQVIQFRLMVNDNFLPYGSSILEGVRRVWRQLILMEDAVMVYRIVRSPERRVFYVDVGNVAPNDIDKYVEKVKTQLKRNQVVDSSTGRVDLRYNPLPVHMFTPVPLLDGRTLTIKQLAEEFDEGKENWVYSVRDSDSQLVPGKIAWCGKNYTAKKLVKVTLDDGGVVKTAPEHPFVLRDGTSKRADELGEGDSLMPLYTEINKKGYKKVYNPKSNKYEFVHSLVAKEVFPEEWESTERRVVHHKCPELRGDNKLNNLPENLQIMNFHEHRIWHQKRVEFGIGRLEVRERSRQNLIRYNKSEKKRKKTSEDNKRYKKAEKMGALYNGGKLHKEHNKIRKAAQLESWRENREKRSMAMRWTIPTEVIELGKELWAQYPHLSRDKFIIAFREDPTIREILEKKNQSFGRSVDKLSRPSLQQALKEGGFLSFGEYKKVAISEFNEYEKIERIGYLNHKVSKIEFIDEVADVYCMTVVGPNGEEDRHNFGIADFNNPCKSLILLKNSTDEDYFIPTRGEFSSRIETLPGGQFPVRRDSLIPLLDGRKITIEELAKEHDEGKENWVYSIQDNTNKFVPGKVIWCGKNYTCDKLHRIWLDDDSYVEMAPEHPVLLRDGSSKKAQDLQPGESLMPFRTKLSEKKDNNHKLKGYTMICDPAVDEWKFVHKSIAEEMQGKEEALERSKEKTVVIHHVDVNKNNNQPNNLSYHGVNSWRQFRKEHLSVPLNHKVERVEVIDDVDDVYCMTVVGPNGEHDRHNFAMISKGAEVAGQMNGIFVKNTGDIEDLQYIQNKLFAGLKIPKSYLGYEADISAKATLCLRLDTEIPLLDGRTLTLSEVIKEFEEGKKLQTYSIDTKTGKVIHGGIKWAGITQENASLKRYWFDNGKYLDCTPNHEFVMRDGQKVQAHEVNVGDSVMPLYKRLGIRDYEEVYHPGKDSWEFTHKAVAQSSEIYTQGKVIHHKDFRKYNNSSENLDCSMTWLEHRRYHQKHISETITDEIRKKNYQDPKSNWNKWLQSPEHRKQSSDHMKTQVREGGSLYSWIHSDELKKSMSSMMKSRWKNESYRKLKIRQNKDRWNDPEFRDFHSGENHWISRKYKNYDLKWVVDFCKNNNILQKKDFLDLSPIGGRYLDKLLKSSSGTWRKFRKEYLECNFNHKVVRIEYLSKKEDVGCLTIDNEFHNFAISAGIFVGNSQEDVRFARTIQRIQRVFLSELNKVAVIHLYSMGFKDADITNFDLSMANPSTISEMQRLELWRSKFEVASVAQDGLLDRNFVYHKLFKLSKEDIEELEEGKRKDKMFDLELDAMQAPAMEAEIPPVGEEEIPPPEGEEAPPIGAAPVGAETPPPAGLPPPPGEESPITAHRDPNAQVAAPNELIKVMKKRKKKKLVPDLAAHAFNYKKTAMDPKRNYSELGRFARAPFGEARVADKEEQAFERNVAELKRISHSIESVDVLRIAHEKKKKKVFSD